MTIRILCIVVALIAAAWISYKIELSGGWTAFFTLLVSAAVGFLATIIPLNYEGYVTTAKSYETCVQDTGQITTFLCIMESPILWYSQYLIPTMGHCLRVGKLL